MKIDNSKRIWCLLLAILMLISVFPAAAAEEPDLMQEETIEVAEMLPAVDIPEIPDAEIQEDNYAEEPSECVSD